mmetsp:Transcript_43132/g.104358  ORF Transcript_43132/g.104358 Transcript_43132/m.104358 type:complete len:312 (+) Transcript_43132:126-1061(+)|eukprot:CAMPEP_0113648470 /NCGR_PEP_ID=MMETSP0017_2-20120614/25714_1 /TAXON_ID=2856 /ORGANISM="Cylindrotheca closterium" /LENGTH=311 /DNA_ID=CAMNT_0000560701 /DNA_START=73 /DNA_END=1008 /DNA_ORIENTATION=+ /assembly_acc=CAM_ASM_000147
MNNTQQQTQAWPSTIRRPRRISSDKRRRQEEDNDDQPRMPTRSSAIVDMEGVEEMMPTTDLYPTVSNLNRHGVAVGQPLANSASENCGIDNGNRHRRPHHHRHHHRHRQQQAEQVQVEQMYQQLPSPPPRRRQQVAAFPPDADAGGGRNVVGVARTVNNNHNGAPTTSNRRPRQRPQTITVPQRGLRRCLSGVTMSSDLVSFDGTEFEAIPPADDYMDDDQLQEYLDQLAKEETRKNRERESLREELFSASAGNNNEDRESLRQLFQQLDVGGDGSNDDYEAYLDRLMEQQIQAEKQYKSKAARRVSEISC